MSFQSLKFRGYDRTEASLDGVAARLGWGKGPPHSHAQPRLWTDWRNRCTGDVGWLVTHVIEFNAFLYIIS